MKSKQLYRGRFAPSPTGALHLGNVRTALISWLRAKLSGGEWLLRVDDLDTPRNRPGSLESLQTDLIWLGLEWDGPLLLQSERLGLYQEVLDGLRKEGCLYACRCSRRQLYQSPRKAEQPRIYPGTCRSLGLNWEPWNGRWPSWRLRVAKAFHQTSGDVIVQRADGFIAYHLATAVDELSMGITEVVRGLDLAVALPAQLAVMEALLAHDQVAKTLSVHHSAGPALSYRHVPLLCDAEGHKLAKRDGGLSLNSLREQGMSPAQVVGQLASGLELVPDGVELNAAQLLTELAKQPHSLDRILS